MKLLVVARRFEGISRPETGPLRNYKKKGFLPTTLLLL